MKKVSILLLFTIFFVSCSGEEPLQNPQTVENVENPKVKVAVRIGFQDNFWGHDKLGDHINLLYNIATYNSIAIKLIELPDIEFVSDDSIDGNWDYMIEFGISFVDLGGNAIYWVILQNADNSDSKSRAVFYPNISLGKIYNYYVSESIGNKVVEQKQYASEGAENQKAKVAINIHENSAYKEGAYNSIAKNLVVLPDVEFESNSAIDGVWDYIVEFGMFFPRDDGSRNIAYWTTLQNADSSNGESRTVFYPDIKFKIWDFADFDQLQNIKNISRDIVEQFRSNYLSLH